MYSLARIKGIEKEKPRKSACFRGFLARHTGFEPVASRLGGDRSILLSYGNITYFILDRPFYISKTRVPNRVPNPDLMAAAVCISHKKPHSTGFFSMHPVALGGYSLPLGVVNTVSSFVTGFHSQYQKTPVVRRLWVYYLTRFHIVSQGKIRVLLCLVCKLCAGKGGCTLSDKDS